MRKKIAICFVSAFYGLSGCSDPLESKLLGQEWRLSARVEFVKDDFETRRTALPSSGLYLAFPFIGGDIYGSASTADFARVHVGEDDSFVLDLTASSKFSRDASKKVGIGDSRAGSQPTSMRMARVATFTMDAKTRERAGFTGWVDASNGHNLVLAYFDRPGSISGAFTEKGHEYGFNIRVENEGFHWLYRRQLSENSSELVNSQWPQQLVLRIAPLRY
jgi:hypothetical protein